MGKFKDNKFDLQESESDDTLKLDLSYFVNHKKYGIERYEDNCNLREAKEALHSLVKLMVSMTKIKYSELKKLGKIEKVEVGTLKSGQTSVYDKLFRDCGIIESKDTHIVILRFGKGDKYRALIIKDFIHQNIVHLLACDFDYSLYDHE